MEVALLPLDASRPFTAWQGLLRASVAYTNKRLYTYVAGGRSSLASDRAVQRLLAQLYNIVAEEKPTFNLVPLLQIAGWTPERLAGLSDLQAVFTSWDAAGSTEMLLEQLTAARAASLPPLQLSSLQAVTSDGEAPAASDAAEGNDVIGGGSRSLFNNVAVGGTFDRLHAGHRVLLAATALVTRCTVYIGVTGDALLVNKKNRELLQPFAIREAATASFIKSMAPSIDVITGELHDPKGMAADIEDMDALVVSQETLAGAEAINMERRQKGFKPLAVITVDLVGGGDSGSAASKLSSTALREQEAKHLHHASDS